MRSVSGETHKQRTKIALARAIYPQRELVSINNAGYWGFLTLTPYRGWSEITFSPRSFIAFIFRSGYAATEHYDAEVGALLPSAERLLAEARGT
jgi:hypothetical protein